MLRRLVLLLLLAGMIHAAPSASEDTPPSLTLIVTSFQIVQGQLVWSTPQPPVSTWRVARAFWRVLHATAPLFPQQKILVWFPSQTNPLRLDTINPDQETMRYSSDLPLAESARAMLEALGCVWDIS